MTTRRGKVYDIPIGRFSYLHSPLDLYSVGIDRVENSDKTGFLMASPEKALCDRLVFTRNLNVQSQRAMRELLFDDLRIDEESIIRFDSKVIEACIVPRMKERMLLALLGLVNSLKRELI
jgi:hypothetical protein